MSVASPAIRVVAGPVRKSSARETALLSASAAVDALAVCILLVGTPIPRPLELVVAAASHLTAVLLMSSLFTARPSRRWLSVTALLAVPLAGVAVASAMLRTSGLGTAAVGRIRRARRRPVPTRAEFRRMSGALSPCEALESDDEDQRRDALTALARRGDPEAIVLLDRAAASRDPDLALSAALALDEIGERAERELRGPEPAEARRGAG